MDVSEVLIEGGAGDAITFTPGEARISGALGGVVHMTDAKSTQKQGAVARPVRWSSARILGVVLQRQYSLLPETCALPVSKLLILTARGRVYELLS